MYKVELNVKTFSKHDTIDRALKTAQALMKSIDADCEVRIYDCHYGVGENKKPVWQEELIYLNGKGVFSYGEQTRSYDKKSI